MVSKVDRRLIEMDSGTPIYYRVWPDGTTQEQEEEPYQWMSDDFVVVAADNEEEALVLSGVLRFD
jgi:hypothetical protein